MQSKGKSSFHKDTVSALCDSLGVSFSLHRTSEGSRQLVCDSILDSHLGDVRYYQACSCEFEGITILEDQAITIHVLSERPDQVPAAIFLHELGHVLDYFQIANTRFINKEGIRLIRESEQAMKERIGEAAFLYLNETQADYYAILLSALIDISTRLQSIYLEGVLEQLGEEQEEKKPHELMFDQFYLEHNPAQLARINNPLHYYRYIMQRIRTTEELFSHVNHCLKLNMLTGFEGSRRDMRLYYPYIRDYCGREIASIDILGKMERFADRLI